MAPDSPNFEFARRTALLFGFCLSFVAHGTQPLQIETTVSSESYHIATQGAVRMDGLNFPYAILLSSSTLSGNIPVGSQIISLSALDPDVTDEHDFGFVSGPGGEDNSAFLLSSNQLQPKSVLDASLKSQYSLRISAIDSTGLSMESNFVISVVNATPSVVNPIADVSVNEDAADTQIDLSNVFNLVDLNKSAISSNPSLVRVVANGNTLTLDYQPNAHGSATITVTGTYGSQSASDSFSVTVGPVADPPVIVSLDGNSSASTKVAEEQTSATNIDAVDADGDALF